MNHFMIGFDFFHGSVLKYFEIFLISGAQSWIIVSKDVFGRGVEFFCSVEDVFIEQRGIDFLLMFFWFDVLNRIKKYLQIIFIDFSTHWTEIVSGSWFGHILLLNKFLPTHPFSPCILSFSDHVTLAFSLLVRHNIAGLIFISTFYDLRMKVGVAKFLSLLKIGQSNA